MKLTPLLSVGVALLAISTLPAYALPRPQQTAADNTKVNKPDRHPDQLTSDQQKNDKSDLETTRQIRKAIVGDKSLSTYAHNVKIITLNGRVTLKGPVRSTAEKTAIASKAAEVAGADHVVNHITIKRSSAAASSSKKHDPTPKEGF